MIKTAAGNLLVLCGVFLFSFLAGEGLVRLNYKKLSGYNMEMWRYASDLKEPRKDPRLPFVHYPGREGGYYGAHLKTNALGFRDRDMPAEKAAGVKRILFLGDSFTLGWGVPFDETYSQRLEKMLNGRGRRVETVNAGVGNYNSVMELELFKLKGLAMDPDLVILMYYINDPEPTPRVAASLEYNLIKHSYLIAFLFDRYIKLKPLMDKHYDWKAYYAGLFKEDSPGFAANRQALQDLIKLCADRKIKLLIVNIPELRVLKDYPFPMATQFIESIAKEGRVPFLDLLPALAPEDPRSLWVTPEDPHANSKANALMAEAIFKKLQQDPSLLH